MPKKNGKLHICVDYWKLNGQTKKDPFMLPFLDLVIDSVAKHEMYSFKMVEEKKKYNIYFRMGCICI
jgi:hypothetical protein